MAPALPSHAGDPTRLNYSPTTLTSMVAFPVQPSGSVTVQVWKPESVDRRANFSTDWVVFPCVKHPPVQSEVQL